MASPMPAAEGAVTFQPKTTYLGLQDLEQRLRVCPSAEAFRAGFTLQDPDVSEVLRVVTELKDAEVYVDPAYPPAQAVDQLVRTIRLLQVSTEVLSQENEQLSSEFSTMQEENQELSEQSRVQQQELDRLRALRDNEQADGDTSELRRKNDDLTRRLEEEYRNTDRFRQQRDQHEDRLDDLKKRLQNAEDDLRSSEDRQRDSEDQLTKLQDDYSELRQSYEALRAEHTASETKAQIGDTLRQQDWKIERMIKENRALELANVELRKQAGDVKTENLEVSEKIIMLDDEMRKLKAREADLDSGLDAAAADKAALLSAQEELRGEVAERTQLLDDFEARFQRQFRSWEEERSTLQAQIQALQRDGGSKKTGAGRRSAGNGDNEDLVEIDELRSDLNEAIEREVLLLEAYEQLELSVASEVDRALAKQSEELKTAGRRVEFLTQRVEEERAGARVIGEHQAQLEDQIKDAVMRNRQYEGGMYGLPQAVEEIHQLKDAVYKEQGRVRLLVQQINVLSGKVEDLADENTVLRKKAGVSEHDKVDTKDVRMQKESTIAQLRSLNALLERQVADLEEERRKLRSELKFRAKYHGQHALEMGLSPNQLLQVEQYVDDMKHGRSDEARLVDQLSHRIEFLEVRLGEVMAYADIPPAMRPALTEFDPVAALTGGGLSLGGGGRGGKGGNLRTPQVEAVKATLLKALGMLREMNTSLTEGRNVSDKDYQLWTQGLITMLTDAEKAVDAVLKDMAYTGNAGQGGAGNLTGLAGGAGPRGWGGGQLLPDMDAGYLADAMADELRDHLRKLARQTADLQATVIKKEATIQQLSDQKAELEKRFGIPIKERKTDYVSQRDYQDMSLEAASLREQLVGALDELAAREREAADLSFANNRYQGKIQTYTDQIKLLYREYAVALSNWKTEKLVLERRVKRHQEEADGYKAAAAEYSKGLDALSKGGQSELQRDLSDTVRRMAVVQIKHAKIARELEASTLGERALGERVEELEQEVRDVSSTCRSRLRYLEASADAAKRRVEALFRELQASVPLMVYQMLAEKHARQQGELRRMVEESADQVVQADEVFRLRDEVGGLMVKYDLACDSAAEFKERLRQAELVANKDERSFDLRLAQEVVGARVGAESSVRRAQLAEAERGRVQRTLEETQTRLREVEDRLTQCAAETELLRGGRADMERRLLGSKTKPEVEDLVRRLDAAEAQAAVKHNDYANLCHRVEEADRKVEQAQRDRQRHLAEITGLRAALRGLAAHREAASVVAKLHEQLDHALAKESLARNALNRSELHRIEAESELRKFKTDLTNCNARAMAAQDNARWSDKQRHEAQAQLDISLAARTEAWKAKLWARKIQQLKVRNDAIADALDLARRRMKKLEDGRNAAELKLDSREDISGLSGKGVSEVVRDAARLHEQLLHLRMDRGKLQREEVLLREKVHYVERVNAELHELIEKYEAEFFQQQVALEADKMSAQGQARQLQDELMRLQERLSGILDRDTDRGDQARKSIIGTMRVGGDQGARLKAHLNAANAGDRDMMIKQIEALRAARQEAEHMRQECQRLADEVTSQKNELTDVRRHHNDALGRLEQQSEALLYALGNKQMKGVADETVVDQMRAVAEVTINELKNRMKERDKAMESLEELMMADKARWVAQHITDREEIKRLNQCLFERNDASINNLKEVLSRVPRSCDNEGGATAAEAQLLREQVALKGEEVAALRALLDEREAAYDVLHRTHTTKVRTLEDELDRLRGERDRETRVEEPSRALTAKLQSQLRAKDDKLRQLRDAFRMLEEKLKEAHRRIADGAMSTSDRLEQLDKDAREQAAELESMKRENQQLQADLGSVRRELTECRESGGAGRDTALATLREQLQAARDKGALAERELAAARAQLQMLKNTERTVMDLTTGMSVEARRQVDELQKRVHVLERQNAHLKRTLQAEDGESGTGGGGAPGDDPSRGNTRRPSAGTAARALPPGTTSRSTTSLGRDPPLGHAAGADQAQPGGMSGGGDSAATPGDPASRTAAAVTAWQESKTLSRKLEDVRKKLASKQQEVVVARAEAERAIGRAAELTTELGVQSAAIRDLQDKLRKAQAGPSRPAPPPAIDLATLRTYAERLEAAEEAADKLRVQLATLQHSSAGAAGAGPKASAAATASDTLRRDAELFEAKLAKDAALAQAKRLRDRLAELFGAEAEAAAISGASAVPAGSVRPRGGGGGAGPRGALPAREAELLSTINNLKTALERATASATPTTKYMAEVQRRKDAQRDMETAKGEADKARAQAATLQRMVTELQVSTAELRRQLRAAQDAVGASGDVAVAAAQRQVSALEELLAGRDRDLALLRSTLAQREQALSAATAAAAQAEQGGSAGGEMGSLRSALAEAEAENEDLKAELNAFDPKFFEEIEDLKHEHYVLGGKVEEYEALILQLSARLGQPPPSSVRQAGRSGTL